MTDGINIGKRIAYYRRQKALSIKELAEKTGLTSSMISQIERNVANPSLNSLRAIAQALDIHMTAFFQGPINEADLVVRKNMRRKLILPDSDGVGYELLSSALNMQIEFAISKMKPGSKSVNTPMAHTGEEAALVLGGSLKLIINGEEIILEDGDSVCIPPNTPHLFHNDGDSEVTLIFAISPPSF